MATTKFASDHNYTRERVRFFRRTHQQLQAPGVKAGGRLFR